MASPLNGPNSTADSIALVACGSGGRQMQGIPLVLPGTPRVGKRRDGAFPRLVRCEARLPWLIGAAIVMGCFAIGILMIPLTVAWVANSLLPPLSVSAGTTFSTRMLEVRRLLGSGAAVHALGCLRGAAVASPGRLCPACGHGTVDNWYGSAINRNGTRRKGVRQ